MVLNVNVKNLRSYESFFSPCRSEFYGPVQGGHVSNTGNISLDGVPTMLLSDQVDVGISIFAMTSIRQKYIDYISVLFSVK